MGIKVGSQIIDGEGGGSVTIAGITDRGATGAALLATTTPAEARAVSAPSRPATGSALHHWRLDQSGTLADRGSAAVALTPVGGGWLRQRPGLYVEFDAICQRAPAAGNRLSAATSIPAGIDVTLAITTAAYDRPPVFVTTEALLWVWDENAALDDFAAIVTTGAGQVYAAVKAAGGGGDVNALTTVSWARPHEFVLTIGGSTVRFYIDGIEVASRTTAGTRAAATEVSVGGVAGNPFGVASSTLLMADARVDLRAWSAAEVLASYELAREIFQPI